MDCTGFIIGVAAFAIIGIMHPVVIKGYYYFGLRIWYIFLAVGLFCLAASLFIAHLIASVVVAIVGISFLWGIHELFEERKRVQKGWHPANPSHGKQTPPNAPNT
jgi:hypothetical protein